MARPAELALPLRSSLRGPRCTAANAGDAGPTGLKPRLPTYQSVASFTSATMYLTFNWLSLIGRSSFVGRERSRREGASEQALQGRQDGRAVGPAGDGVGGLVDDGEQ